MNKIKYERNAWFSKEIYQNKIKSNKIKKIFEHILIFYKSKILEIYEYK